MLLLCIIYNAMWIMQPPPHMGAKVATTTAPPQRTHKHTPTYTRNKRLAHASDDPTRGLRTDEVCNKVCCNL